MAELLDLDAEVLHAYLSEVTGWVYELAAGRPPQRILDLGSGTGTGALALARRFGDAEVIAVDMSAYLLGRLRDKADALGVAERIRTVEADLDAEWPAIGPVDLAWASSSLHHMADPDRVLTEVFATMNSGGLLVVAELDSFPRFLPDDAGPGDPGGWKRAATPCWTGSGPTSCRTWAPTGQPAERGGVRHRGRADLRHPPDASASRRHGALRAGFPAAPAFRPRRPAQRRRPGRARHADRRRRAGEPLSPRRPHRPRDEDRLGGQPPVR